jgi:hypothetical protein
MLEILLWPYILLGRAMLLFDGNIVEDAEEGMTARECRFTSREGALGENTLGVAATLLSDTMTPLPATIIAGEEEVEKEDDEAERARATGKEWRLLFAAREDDTPVVVTVGS